MENNDNRQDKAIIVLENNYQHMTKQLNDLENTVKEGFADIKQDIKCFQAEAEVRYVTNEKFLPIRMIVYGMVGAVLIYALTRILDLT